MIFIFLQPDENFKQHFFIFLFHYHKQSNQKKQTFFIKTCLKLKFCTISNNNIWKINIDFLCLSSLLDLHETDITWLLFIENVNKFDVKSVMHVIWMILLFFLFLVFVLFLMGSGAQGLDLHWTQVARRSCYIFMLMIRIICTISFQCQRKWHGRFVAFADENNHSNAYEMMLDFFTPRIAKSSLVLLWFLFTWLYSNDLVAFQLSDDSVLDLFIFKKRKGREKNCDNRSQVLFRQRINTKLKK